MSLPAGETPAMTWFMSIFSGITEKYLPYIEFTERTESENAAKGPRSVMAMPSKSLKDTHSGTERSRCCLIKNVVCLGFYGGTYNR